MRERTRWLFAAAACIGGLSVQAATPMHGESVRIPAGETAIGDRYVLGDSVEVAGRLQGDLLALGDDISVSGEVLGDVQAGGGSVKVEGRVGESVRVAAGEVVVTGTIEGDLLCVCGSLRIERGARIVGDLWMMGGKASLAGAVGGGLRLQAGQLLLAGTVGGDADVNVDALAAEPQARIGGDLRYRARRIPGAALEPLVAGKIHREEIEEEAKDSWGPSPWGVALWIVKLLGAAVVGLLALRLWPGRAARSTAAVAQEPVMSLGLGLGTGLVLPMAAALLAVISLLIGLPLAVIVWLLVLIGLYLGKLPVALWLGERVLRRRTPDRPRPAALLLGLLLLYVAFSLPYAGTLLWFLATLVGLGALLLALWRRGEPAPAMV